MSSCRGCGGMMPDKNLIALHVRNAIYEMVDNGNMCKLLECNCGFISELPEIPAAPNIKVAALADCEFKTATDYADEELVSKEVLEAYVQCKDPEIDLYDIIKTSAGPDSPDPNSSTCSPTTYTVKLSDLKDGGQALVTQESLNAHLNCFLDIRYANEYPCDTDAPIPPSQTRHRYEFTSPKVLATAQYVQEGINCLAEEFRKHTDVSVAKMVDDCATSSVFYNDHVLVDIEYLKEYVKCEKLNKYTTVNNDNWNLKFTYPNGTTKDVDFNGLRNQVTGLSFNEGTRTLTLSQQYGGNKTVVISGVQDVHISNIEYNDANNTVTYTYNNPSKSSITVPAGKATGGITNVNVDNATINGNGTTTPLSVNIKFDGKTIVGKGTDNEPYKIKVFTDGVTATGSGTEEDPIKAIIPAVPPAAQPAPPTITTPATPPQNTDNVIYVDGTTITGNGTQSNPLKAVVTGGTGGQADGNTKNQSLEYTEATSTLKLTDTDNNFLETVIKGTVKAVYADTAGLAKLPSSNTTELPTTIYGRREALLGRPDAVLEVEFNGKKYGIPAFEIQ